MFSKLSTREIAALNLKTNLQESFEIQTTIESFLNAFLLPEQLSGEFN